MPGRSFRLSAILLILAAFVPAVRAEEPSAAQQAILDLDKSEALFDKTQWKTVRTAFGRLFEEQHAGDLRKAYGDDFEALTQWLEKRPDIKWAFYTAIDDRFDKVPAVLSIFKEIWKKNPEELERFPQLAIATAVVWDDPRGVYDYRHQQVRTKSILPDKMIDALGNFQYMAANEKLTEGRLKFMPWEFLTFVIDHKTPLKEREWAQKYYLTTRGKVKGWHQDVPYDHDMLRGEQEPGSSLKPKLTDREYTLSNIREYGGVCAQQADFAARIGKSVGVPAVYCTGTSAYRGGHAWWMYIQVVTATKDVLKVNLVSDGRIEGFQKDQFYTGQVLDPQTGKTMLDRDMERRLAVVGRDAPAKRQADLVMRAYPWLSQQRNLDTAGRVEYLDRCLNKVSQYNEAAWLEFAKLCVDGKLEAEQKKVVLNHLGNLQKTFAGYPDFVARLTDDLLLIQTDAGERIKSYEQLIASEEKAGRPDLACASRLKMTELWIKQEKWQNAGQGLITTIKKFPTEGRYIPQLTKKLQEVAGKYKDGNTALASLYLELIPAMVIYYGKDEPPFCTKLYDEGLAYMESNNLEKQTQLLKSKTEQARVVAKR